MKKCTIFLGAGASIAYKRWPHYPSMDNLLSKMLSNTDSLDVEFIHKQKLLLSFTLSQALKIPTINLLQKCIPNSTISNVFNDLTTRMSAEFSHVNLLRLFQLIKNIESSPMGTKAYWCLNNTLAVYFKNLYEAELHHNYFDIYDQAHKRLIELIDQMLDIGYLIHVVDFNYDCIFEMQLHMMGENKPFWLDCGRERIAVYSSLSCKNLTDAIYQKAFSEPSDQSDETELPKSVKIIKPHGDWSTYLLGTDNIYYAGGRHSNSEYNFYQKWMADINTDDTFVRSSILPPTDSFQRHNSVFYTEEKTKLINSLKDIDVVINIGWRAAGSDDFYKSIFEPIFANSDTNPTLYLIDNDPNNKLPVNLKQNLDTLYCNKTKEIIPFMSGFDESIVEKLHRLLIKC